MTPGADRAVEERAAGLLLHDITKRFGATLALDRVTLAVRPGEVHALLGENGAGKTTLMRVAYGVIRPDSGRIEVTGADGRRPAVPGFASPRAARAAGIGMVHQHFTSIPAFTVAENIALAAGWRESGAAAVTRAERTIAEIGLPLLASAYAADLSVQLRQRLEIVKALATRARILLLDEPTAMLAPREVGELLVFLRARAALGMAVVLITHKLDEVLRVADQVTVLRRGAMVLTDAAANQNAQTLARAMIGAELPSATRSPPHPGEVRVRLARVKLAGWSGAAPISAEFRAGEIAGVAAIEGNGQRPLLRAISGVDRTGIVGGAIDVGGPVAFVPEDRTAEGLIPEFTLAENLLLGRLDRSRWWLNWDALRARTAELVAAFDVRGGGVELPATALSGGNQQKFMLARALSLRPAVVVTEDPTRGLDVAATAAVHRQLRDAADSGAAVIMHASDLDEVREISDRLYVMARGALHEVPATASREEVGAALLGLDRPS